MELRDFLPIAMMVIALGGLWLSSRGVTRASAADIAKLQVGIDNLQRDVSSLRLETAALRDSHQGVQASLVHLTGLAEHNREEIKILRERVRNIELERKAKNEES